MTIETDIHKNSFSFEQRTKISVHDTEHLTFRARVCLDIITRWGMVAGIESGEDSAGRAKFELQSVDDIVTRAVSTTNALFRAFDKAGWIHELPTLDEAEELMDAKKLTKEQIEKLDI